ncbi:MAG: hypothetical protein IMZ61_06045 [Planctomycetes bacterium]|nr:hypothetical protein [Planctomycetota bacterium]
MFDREGQAGLQRPGTLLKVYIDIDGVLLRNGKNGPELIPRFRRVIRYLCANFDCYWLTTHVRHGSGRAGAIAKLTPYLKKSRIDPAILDSIKPTEWETLKTEAIDFSRPFIWLDDDPLPTERRILQEKGCADSLVDIDWRKRAMRLTVCRIKRIRRSILQRLENS